MAGETAAGVWTEALLGALPDPVLLVDAALGVTAANAAARRLVGSDPVGRPLPVLLAPEHADQVRRAVRGARGPGTWVAGTTVLRPDGSRRPVRVHVGGIRAEGVEAALVTLVASPEATAPAQPALSEQLAEALRGDAVVLHYQPIVRLDDRRPVLVEALVRWEHPTRGLLWPADFLSTADTEELVGPLGRRVLREACHAASAWGQGLNDGRRIRVAVNLSERQLLQPGTATFVREALTVAHCAPEQLVLEIPESALLRDPDAAAAAMRALKDVGVGLAVDDLGTGSSSLSYLARFPTDLVKIDRALIAGLGTDTDQSAVVASLVSLAQALDVPCVAEGIETADQLAVLQLLGCELGQGYLFTRPMTRHALEAWLLRAHTPRQSSRTGRPAVVPPDTIARALSLQEEGASLHTIAARLNAEGHRNAGGRRWHHTAVAQLIAAQRFPDLPL